MKDLYEVLGTTQNASAEEIKKAYRLLARKTHTDRQGGDHDKMVLLNEAYEILSDPERRHNFDTDWKTYQDTDIDQKQDVTFDAYLPAGNLVAYSQTFKIQHQSLVIQYEQEPLFKHTVDHHFQFIETNIYRLSTHSSSYREYHDIFTFIDAQETARIKKEILVPANALSPIIAIKIFMDFLNGDYYGNNLVSIKEYLSSEIRKARLNTSQSYNIELYQSIFDIILMTNQKSDRSGLLFLIKKITDFSKAAPDSILDKIIPLFYNKFFRNLYAQALHLYWTSNEDLFHVDNLSRFNGYQEAKELLAVLRERLSNNRGNQDLSQLTHYIKLLCSFEKDSYESNDTARISADYRQAAFHFLDWIPVFIEESNRQILVNLFLQIGIKFQQASRLEARPAIKMADEQLALKMYLTAVGIGHHSTPDVENYANIQALKYIAAFQFQDPMLIEVISALKKRALIVADIFPFFQINQSNISFLRQENQAINLMRKLLNTMVKIQEHNKTHTEIVAIDHSSVTILYQAYEACLKNWYQEEFDAEVEKKFRLELMEALLFENSWTFLDVEQRIDSPWIMVDRDTRGWMNPTRSLPFNESVDIVKYKTINGAEVNHKTGKIHFFMTPWTQGRPIYEKVFTLFDLQEMLEKNIEGAIFSLDPVDPDRAYHPFNAMRFAPSQLCESELLNTMLLTDYVLKFLTTNQEVQGQYPFEQRPVFSMIQHLPAYLRKIIEDFHSEQHPGALHRFWIEAQEINVSLSDETLEKEGITRIGLGDLKMVVKKHRMERDIHGELKDVGDENEGWPIYVLTPQQMSELNRGVRRIEGHAMIFIYLEVKLFFWENNAVLCTHIPIDFDETLMRLYKQSQVLNGKKFEPNIQNMRLLYRTTKEMSRQAGLSHRYSPEFIFAHEFTVHYDAFAQYLPEFGRLKELSKLSALIRFLNSIRSSNQESIEALDFILNASSHPIPTTDAYIRYNQVHKEIQQQVNNQFKEWSRSLATSALQTKWRDQINKIKNEIGTLTFTRYSKEVNEECARQVDYSYRNSRGYSRAQIEKIIDDKRSDIASQISKLKQDSVRSQITPLFSSHLSSLGSYAYTRLIDAFMNGNIHPLADALSNQEKVKAQEEIKKQFPRSSTSDIALALDDPHHAALKRIAKEESSHLLREQKVVKNNLESGFVEINLGKNKEPVNLDGQCFWVPASVRHDVRRDDTTGLTRYSFFVYGGVRVQPKINVIAGGNRSLGGNVVGGKAFNKTNNTVLYQKVGPNGEHLKFGISKNPATRYTSSELNGGRLKIVAQGSRQEMLRLERNLHSTLPIGPEERQKCYINIQASKGYKIPPYK